MGVLEAGGQDFGLRAADIGFAKLYLPLQVRAVDQVIVPYLDLADPGGREIERAGATQCACSDNRDRSCAQFLHAGAADLLEQDMALVTVDIGGRETHRRAARKAVEDEGSRGAAR